MRKCRTCVSLTFAGLIATHAIFPCADEHAQYCELHEGNPHGVERSFSDFEVVSLANSLMTASASVSFSMHPSLLEGEGFK